MRVRSRCLALVVLVALSVVVFRAAGAADNDTVKRGKYLLHAGGCISCHTAPDTLKAKGPILGGGHPIKSEFGTFFGPNITPHQKHGIGAWSEADFIQAMRHGRSPDGRHYFPSFPYVAFTGMRIEDLKALWAYLRTVPPVARPNQAHELRFPYKYRFGLGFWKWLYFRPGAMREDPKKPKSWNRGAYLVNALGHCGECHTPRTSFGGLRPSMTMAGSRLGPKNVVPNITPHKTAGIGDWSTDDIVSMLKTGGLPNFDYVGGDMADVVSHGTSKLSDTDLKAMAEYLTSLPAIATKP